MDEPIPTESPVASHSDDISTAVDKLRQDYLETIQAATEKLRNGIKNVKVNITHAKLAEYKETLRKIKNIHRYSIENGLTA
uniref:WGS project CBMG000000000 data, contig CS5907-c001999 n=1 Tax=Fusarium acuminatum CS5907 TaxID=1318461 RepID=A0A090MFL4_9HYPO|nr:unnamed protein product [Fusarium acuminatum CS5907]